jgi:hypothetical protein
MRTTAPLLLVISPGFWTPTHDLATQPTMPGHPRGTAMLLVSVALAQDIVLDGVVPDDGLDHFRVPFEVPGGVAEITVHHDDLSEDNILDWGLEDPSGFRGWGGGNTEPAVVSAEAASRSYLPGPIVAGTWSVVVGKARLTELPAGYHVEITLGSEVTLPPQPERAPYVPAAPLEVGERWYAGDLHVHSRESGDATATFDEIADLARQQGLDFVIITDHNTISHLDYLVDAQSRHPDVLFVPGTEFTTYDGHAGAFGVRTFVDHKLGQPGVTIEAAAAAYEAQGALLSMNHPALDLGGQCIGCAWNLSVPDTMASIEVGTGGWEPAGRLFTPAVLELWEELLSQGHRLAAVGGSDDHRAGTDTGPLASPIGHPTTLVYARELSEQAILEGIRAGRTVVKLQDAADPMLELSLDGRSAEALATGASGDTLVWVVDGVPSAPEPISQDPQQLVLELPEGAGRVRAEIRRELSPRTIASPLWVEEPEPLPPGPAEGCGCGGMQAPSFAAIFVLAGFLRRGACDVQKGRVGAARRRGRGHDGVLGAGR